MCRLEEEAKEVERKKQKLMDQYRQHKRGSGSSSLDSSGHLASKKSSVDSAMDSPTQHKRVLKIHEYEEGDSSCAYLHSTPPLPTQTSKISELEERVKEDLDAGLTASPRQQLTDKVEEFGAQWSKYSGSSGSLYSAGEISRHSPGHWASPTSSPSEQGTTQPLPPQPLCSPAITASSSRQAGVGGEYVGGTRGEGGHFSHADSEEWTEFTCASVSGSSVEATGVQFSSVGMEGHISSGMSEFDPIVSKSTADCTD